MERSLLLISNSKLFGSGYLDHCESAIRDILRERKEVLFVPYARPSGITHDEYTAKARERFERMGFSLGGIHEQDNPAAAVEGAKAIFIGGGNTFVLLNALYQNEIVDAINRRVAEGVPYIGTSAGANVAGRTMMTTNDMPIIYPPSFSSINLVPFIINPHYLDLDKNSRHMGETRETRIKEYHIFNDHIVVGLREGAMLHIVGNNVNLQGTNGARIFRRGQEPTEHTTGVSLDFLLTGN
ncbi:dipeptidase PepE [Candidatus Pacearchaeota archaeon]|nr:dipeptidase PepE [Candidatus Pacearchaeota archaeon]